MPRYFFHVTNGDTLADEVGEEFELVEAARGHATAVARELSRNGLHKCACWTLYFVRPFKGIIYDDISEFESFSIGAGWCQALSDAPSI